MATTKYNSIAEWAKAIGSSAKTHAGQRKAILATIPHRTGAARGTSLHEGRVTQYHPYHQSTTKAQYLATRQRDRQRYFADTHPLTRSMPPPATWTDCVGFDMTSERQLLADIESGKRAKELGFEPTIDFEPAAVSVRKRITPVSLLDLQDSRTGFAVCGDWYIYVRESVSWDRDRYSKSWHNAHGGAKSVDARTVYIRRVRPDGTLERRDQSVDGWRGNYLLGALFSAGVLVAHRDKQAVRLHPAYDLDVLRTSRLLTIYERKLAGEHIDYCAVRGSVTFHAPSIREAVVGLRGKLRKAGLKAAGKLIDHALGSKLGFCESGMREFCRVVGLDLTGAYAPSEIEQVVRAHWSECAPFAAELRTLANAVNYPIPADMVG